MNNYPKRTKREGPGKLIFSQVRYISIYSISIYRIRVLSVFIGKNSKALKRRKYKGFYVFLLHGMLAILLK